MSLEQKSHIISNDILRTNKLLARMNPLRVPVKAMNITSDEFRPQVHRKRKVQGNSSSPLKKRHIVPNSIAYDNGQSKKMVDDRLRTLNFINNINKAMTLPFNSYHIYPAMINTTNYASILMSKHCKRNFDSTQTFFRFKSAASSKDLCATLHANVNTIKQAKSNDIMQNQLTSDCNTPLHPSQNSLVKNKLLSLRHDKDNLSELQCLIRENIELFTASEEDENSYFR